MVSEFTHCLSGENFPVREIRHSWANTPPMVVASGGRSPAEQLVNFEARTLSMLST